uniref:Uncharacterized protein n=1 Tax=Ditylum brightwellii TaxID=49249 RepID=A0A7S4QH32_9STRA|mmetsp:Transcript_59499/g.88355  ORF Transcript_59499/g.88355 Transcript_59499/m.88355 type:complete len:288 (+) Transcript_59499:83-946(+)
MSLFSNESPPPPSSSLSLESSQQPLSSSSSSPTPPSSSRGKHGKGKRRGIKSNHVRLYFTMLLVVIVYSFLSSFYISTLYLNDDTDGNNHRYHNPNNIKVNISYERTEMKSKSSPKANKYGIDVSHGRTDIKKADKDDKAKIPKIITSPSSSSPSYHFVVSSDCSTFQKWQVFTQIHSALSVQQTGKYTWIISGCSSDGKMVKDKTRSNTSVLTEDMIRDEVTRHFHTSSSTENDDEEQIIQRPNLHFTPDYTDMSVYGGPYADGSKKRVYVNPQNGKTTPSNYGND